MLIKGAVSNMTNSAGGGNKARGLRRAPLVAVSAVVVVAVVVASEIAPQGTVGGPRRPPPTETLPVPWVGLNNWALASSSDVNESCGGNAQEQLLEQKMTRWQEAGVDVVRFAAYQSFAIDGGGRRNWAAFDRVFASAQAHNIYLIPILGNNWVDCDYWGKFPELTAKDEGTPLACGGSGNWYDIGYKHPYNGYITSYRQWVADFVGRYASHPVLATWELINEPSEVCIHDFFVDIAGLVRAIDPTTPVSLGSGGTESWTRDGGYRRETALADWATAHDYGNPDEPLPGNVRSNMKDAAALRKPFYVGESGIRESTNCDSVQRADQLRAKMQAAFAAGASGYLLWAYAEDREGEKCGFDFGPASPIMRIFAEF
jgi:mannan endo-1,4-beta-mannosidase